MRAERAGLVMVAVGLAMAVPAVSRAQAPPSSLQVGRASLLLVVRALPDEEAPLIDVLTDAARRRDLSVTFDAKAGSVLRVDVDVASSTPSVTVVDLRDDAVLTRRQIPRTGSNEVLREEIALVVASAIDAARARTPAPKAPAPPPASPAPSVAASPPEASPRASTTWNGDVFAEVRSPREDAPLVPALGLGLRTSFDGAPLRPSVALLGGWRSPSGVDGDEVDVRVTGGSLRLLAGAVVFDGDKVAFGARVGPGLSILRIGARSRSPNVDVRPPSTVTAPTATGVLDAGWKLGGGASLELGVGVDMLLVRRRVVLKTDSDGTVDLLTPARLQPFGMLSVVFPLGGGR